MPRKRFTGRLVAAVAASAAFMVLSMQPNFAQSTQGNFIERAAYCFDLMINDSAAHARECAGTAASGPSDSLLDSKSGGGSPDKPDPCQNPNKPAGVPGNAGNSYDPCTVSSGFIAPFIAGMIDQVAMILWPPVEPESAETTAG